MTKTTLIVWKYKEGPPPDGSPGGGDSLQFVGKGPARALYEWLNMTKVRHHDVKTIEVMVKED